MERTSTVHVVVGNPRAGGRTTTAGIAVAEAIAGLKAGLSVELIELADHAAEMFDWGSEVLGRIVSDVQHGTGLVVISPTYKASFTGLMKGFLDRFDAGSLTGVTTVPVMLGGSAEHTLAVDTQLRPVLVELGATMPTRGLYVIDGEIDAIDATVAAWLEPHREVLTRQLG